MKRSLKKSFIGTLFILLMGFPLLSWGQTTASYDFSDPSAESGFNAIPPVALDANIGFASFRNSGTSNPGIFSDQLRLYQNATKGGSIIVYAQNDATITSIVIYASTRTGPAEYTVDGGSAIPITISGGSYTINSINGTSEVEFYQKDGSSSNRIYVDSFDVTYTLPSSGPTLTATPTTLSNLDYNVGEGPSTAQSFEVSGADLDETDVTVSVPGASDFEISETEGSGYTDSITLTDYDGTATDIYVRLKSGLVVDDYTDDVTISGGGGADVTVALSGTVAPTPPDNDLCADAIALTVNGGTVEGTMENATFTAPFDRTDVWYSITPAYNETYTITVSNYSGDLDVELYNQGSACPTTDSYINNSASGGSAPEVIEEDLVSGTTYYVRVIAWNEAAEDTFDIAVTAPAAPDPCETPDNQPTSLQFTEVTYEVINGSFTASDADSYLVVISEAASLSENPVDETTYSADDVLGNGTVLQASSSTSFTATDLDAETQYYIFVFAYNNECLDGPLYYTTTPLNGSTTTTDAPNYPTPGDIYITEVSDASDFNNDFMEIFNLSDSPIDISTTKLVMLSDGTVWNLSDFSPNVIPAKSFLIISRGNDLNDFESEFGSLNDNTEFMQGSSAMYFGNGRRWQLYEGGTENTADGTLIDDTTSDVADGDRDYQNIFTATFINTADSEANPGELDYLIYVDGGWVNDVEIDGSTGTEDAIFYDTYTASTAVEINDLYIDSTADLEIEDVLKVNGDIDNDGTIVFVSNASGTGQFDEFTGSIDGDGEVTVERYIPAGRAFRLLSSAVTTTSTINDNWQEGGNNMGTNYPADNQNPNPGYGTHITGATDGANGFDATNSGNPSLFYMDNSNQSWVPITNTDANTLQAGVPYRLMVRGSRAVNLNNDEAVADNTTLRTTGALFTGTHNSTTISGTEGHYNFFGNPYQAAIDMDAVIAASTNINDGFYLIWDPTLADRGAFVAVDLVDGGNSNGSSEANQYLQPGQAAFVYSLGAGTLQIQETHKAVAQDQTAVFNTISKIDLRLYEAVSYAENGKSTDALRIKFSEDGNNGVDSKDAKKMANLDENLATYSYEEEKLMSIESRVTPTEDDVIQIFSNQYRHNNYVFEAHVSYLDNNMEAYLKDQWTESEVLLENGATTSYAFEIDNDDEESSFNDRFLIIFKQSVLGVEDAFGSNFALFPNPGSDAFYINTQGLQQQQVSITLTNIVGQHVYQNTHTVSDNGTVQVATTALQNGVYIVTLTSNDGSVYTSKWIKK